MLFRSQIWGNEGQAWEERSKEQHLRGGPSGRITPEGHAKRHSHDAPRAFIGTRTSDERTEDRDMLMFRFVVSLRHACLRGIKDRLSWDILPFDPLRDPPPGGWNGAYTPSKRL